MSNAVLRIDASARRTGSVSRQLALDVIAQLAPTHVTTRDLAETPIPQITEDWVAANFTRAENRSEAQRDTLALSDRLVAEIDAADILVIGLPIYNFGVPSALKAWIDQIARAGLTFRYTETGPEGLLGGKRAIVALASGGTEAGSDLDFASGYISHVLGFIGITDVRFVTADRLMVDADTSMAKAAEHVAALAA